MSLSLADGITQVRGFLNEATAAFWTDAEITYWIQEGVSDFSSKTLMIEADDDITLSASQLSYSSADAAFLATIIEPYAVIYNNTAGATFTGLMKVHPRKLGNLLKATPGKPAYYALHNRKLYIWPLASAAEVVAGATVTVLYSKVTNDITEIEDEYQHIPLLYAKAMAKMKDQKFQEAQSLMSQYVMMANFERADKHGREEDTYDMFKLKSGGGEAGAK
jgi:hypothetical protein